MIEKYRKKKQQIYLFGYKIEDIIEIFVFFITVVAIYVIYDIVEHNIWARISFAYLLFSFLMCKLNKDDKKREITHLEQEIRRLENIIKSDKDIIKQLEEKLENKNNETKD